MFEGVFTALVTPFTRKGEIDETALRRLVDAQVKAGVAGIVPVGTTGESPTVSHEENVRVIEIVIDEANGKVPIIAGTGSNSTQEAIEMTALAAKLGASASLQVAPYYNKPSREGMYRHFAAIADAVDLPVILYNIPGRTGKNMEIDTILKLAQHTRIVGVKEVSGNLIQTQEVIAQAPKGFSILSGDDYWTLPLLAMGAHGVISVVSNIVPQLMIALCTAMKAGNLAAAREANSRMMGLFRAFNTEVNPIPIKYAMAKAGMLEEVYRLPLWPLADELKGPIDAALKELKLI